LIISLLLAVAIAPSLVSFLSEGGHLRSNYRGEMLPCPLGILITAAALTALIPLALLAGLVDANTLNLVGLPLILGVAALGIADDAFAGSSRGWRGHPNARGARCAVDACACATEGARSDRVAQA
jgi:hypothetical protein